MKSAGDCFLRFLCRGEEKRKWFVLRRRKQGFKAVDRVQVLVLPVARERERERRERKTGRAIEREREGEGGRAGERGKEGEREREGGGREPWRGRGEGVLLLCLLATAASAQRSST